MIIAGDRAMFGQPEIKLGTIPGCGGTQRLIRAVGKAKAMDLILTGRMMKAEEAERAGLVARIVDADKLVDEAVETAATIATYDPVWDLCVEIMCSYCCALIVVLLRSSNWFILVRNTLNSTCVESHTIRSTSVLTSIYTCVCVCVCVTFSRCMGMIHLYIHRVRLPPFPRCQVLETDRGHVQGGGQ